MKIYIVIECVGQWSDVTSTCIKAFYNESSAKEFISNIEKEIKKFNLFFGEDYWEFCDGSLYKACQYELRKLGVSIEDIPHYYIEEIELDER